jgi:anti-anti-sigma factor
MAKVICKKNDNAVFVEMSGDLNMQHIQKLKQYFLSLREASIKECIIDVAQVSSVDLSFVEMFVSFMKTMKSADKAVLFHFAHDDNPVSQFIDEAGLRSEFTFVERGSYGF